MQSSVTKWIASERQTFENKEKQRKDSQKTIISGLRQRDRESKTKKGDKGKTVKRRSLVTQWVVSERQRLRDSDTKNIQLNDVH